MNRKTRKKINSLYGYELTELYIELQLRGYSNLLVGQKKERLLQEIGEENLLKALLKLGYIDKTEVRWKWRFFKRELIWKETSKSTKIKYNASSASNKYPPLYYLFLLLIISCSIFYFKTSIAHLLFSNSVCAKVEERDETRVVELALELNNQIHKGKRYKTDLQALLSDRVFWFKGPKKSKHKIPLGTRKYDKFCFCEEPIDKFVGPETFENGSFKFTVLGAYRYTNPKDTLYRVQRLHVEIDGGLISSVKSFDEENDIIERVNKIHRYFWILPVILSITFFLFLSLSDEMQKFLIKTFMSSS